MSDNLFLQEEALVILTKARDALSDSKLLLDNQRYADSAERSYYAAFHMAVTCPWGQTLAR